MSDFEIKNKFSDIIDEMNNIILKITENMKLHSNIMDSLAKLFEGHNTGLIQIFEILDNLEQEKIKIIYRLNKIEEQNKKEISEKEIPSSGKDLKKIIIPLAECIPQCEVCEGNEFIIKIFRLTEIGTVDKFSIICATCKLDG